MVNLEVPHKLQIALKTNPRFLSFQGPLQEGNKLILWGRVYELSTAGIVCIANFAKRVPGFRNLSISDQSTLLKCAYLEIVVSGIEIFFYFCIRPHKKIVGDRPRPTLRKPPDFIIFLKVFFLSFSEYNPPDEF